MCIHCGTDDESFPCRSCIICSPPEHIEDKTFPECQCADCGFSANTKLEIEAEEFYEQETNLRSMPKSNES